MLGPERGGRTCGFAEPPSLQRSAGRVRPPLPGAAGTAARPAPPRPAPSWTRPQDARHPRARQSPPAPPAPRRPETPQLAAGAPGSARAAGHSGDCSPQDGRPAGPLCLPEPQTFGVRLAPCDRRRCQAGASASKMCLQRTGSPFSRAGRLRPSPRGSRPSLVLLAPGFTQVPGSLHPASYVGLKRGAASKRTEVRASRLRAPQFSSFPAPVSHIGPGLRTRNIRVPLGPIRLRGRLADIFLIK